MKTKTILLTLTTLFAAAESGDAQTAPNDKKVLVAYFSHSGNTRAVAERIAAATGADLFEIVPQKPYPAEYRAVVDQARREIGADYRPALKTDLPDAGRYDVIYIGSPCWWHQPAMVVCTFLEAYDLKDKVIVPFITYGATTYLNESMQKIYKLTPDSKHIPETLPEDLDPEDITTPGRPDDAGIDMPGNASGTEAWLKRIGIIE